MARMKTYFVILCSAFGVVKLQQFPQLPAFVKPCRRSDPNLNECMRKAMNDLVPYNIREGGNPEMGIRQTDPLHVPHLYLDTGDNPNLFLRCNLTNLFYHGGAEGTVLEAKMDLEKLIFGFTYHFPKIYIEGTYKTEGKFLIFTFEGSGDCHFKFDEVILKSEFYGKKTNKSGEDYFKLDRYKLSMDAKKFGGEFKDLFKGNKEWSGKANEVLNDNSEILFQELRPVFDDSFGRVSAKIVDAVFSRFPLRILFPE